MRTARLRQRLVIPGDEGLGKTPPFDMRSLTRAPIASVRGACDGHVLRGVTGIVKSVIAKTLVVKVRLDGNKAPRTPVPQPLRDLLARRARKSASGDHRITWHASTAHRGRCQHEPGDREREVRLRGDMQRPLRPAPDTGGEPPAACSTVRQRLATPPAETMVLAFRARDARVSRALARNAGSRPRRGRGSLHGIGCLP